MELPTIGSGVDHADLLSYIQRYKQVGLLQEIENRFGAAIHPVNG